MCAKFKVVTTFSRHLVFDALFYERKDCPLKGDRGHNKLTLIVDLNNTFVERSTQYSSFSSRNSPQILVVNVNNSQKMPLRYFHRPYWRMRIQKALLFWPSKRERSNRQHLKRILTVYFHCNHFCLPITKIIERSAWIVYLACSLNDRCVKDITHWDIS